MRLNPSVSWAKLVILPGLVLALAAPLVMPPAVLAQSTQPSAERPAESWAEAIGALADALGGQEPSRLSAVLTAAPSIRKFGTESAQSPQRLMSAAASAKLLGVHAYPRLPQTLATDLADDFRAANDVVPEPVRQRMIPADEAAARRANATAAEWIAQVLEASADQPVGVLILWPEERRGRIVEERLKHRAVFVLVRGELVEGRFTIRHITFGDPLEKPR